MTIFAVLGANGQVGGATARQVLAAGHRLRVILRDAAKAEAWTGQGAEVAFADVDDADQLAVALEGVEAAFLMNPPAYADPDPFAVAARRAEGFAQAVVHAQVERIVLLSSISAHLPSGNGMIHTNHLFEQRLAKIDTPVAFLRPGYFLENWAHVQAVVETEHILPSMLFPLDAGVPMVGVSDIGALAAKLLGETWVGRRVVELAGPTNLSSVGVARILTQLLGSEVQAAAVPRAEWAAIFLQGGMSQASAAAMVEMYDGFNDDTIRFEGAQPRRGTTRAADILSTIFVR